MKILLVTTKAGPGGVQTFLAVLARFLATRGHEVMVAAGGGDYLPAQLEGSPVVFRRLISLSGRLCPLAIGRYILELRQILAAWPAEVVHFNSSHVMLGILGLFGRKKMRTVFTVHGLSVLDSRYEAGWLRPWYMLVYRFLMSRADRLVFVSRHNLNEAKENKLTTEGEVIYNGLANETDEHLSLEAARAFLSQATKCDLSSQVVVGSVGRFAYQKNYDFLIKNWPALLAAQPNLKLVIIGDGEDRGKLVAMIESLKLQDSVFLVSAAPASLYLKAFNLFVLPSRYEGLPISLLEAMAAGCPILASQVGGNAELLRHEAELYPFNDEKLFIDGCLRLLNNEALRQEVIAANTVALADFGVEEMGRRYLEVYS